MKADVIIAIDPDCDKSGFAMLFMSDKSIVARTFSFPFLIDFTKQQNETCIKINKKLIVLVEASWLISGNWHVHPKDSKQKAALKGNAVGRNHETGRKIVEMLKYYNIDVQEVTPLKKHWKGENKKITSEEIRYFIPELPKRTNQEERDSALLAWYHAGLPIKVKPK